VSVITTSALPNSARPLSITDRGWTFGNDAGQPALARRHPLTVEGEEVGSFQVALTCGDTPETYQVSYSERRSMRSRVGSDSLKQIDVVLAGRTLPLKVVSSEPGLRTLLLTSSAQGAIPASSVKDFASGRSRSFTILTLSGTDESTAIRMGNSGVAQNLEQLAESCRNLPAVQPPARGVHAEAKPRE
jgi:hypothetical protein